MTPSKINLLRRLREERQDFRLPSDQLKHTIRQIGKGIKAGAHFLPIIKHAQRLASKAAPKDYIGQIANLYSDFVKRWRYVRDPIALETLHVSGPAIYGQILGFDARKDKGEHGVGDCDDSSIAIGSELMSIGFPVRIVTTAPPHGSRALFNHVFVQAKIPKIGWYSVDPVGFPKHGPGWTPPHSRIAFWGLDGENLGYKGHFPKSFNQMFGQADEIQTLQGDIEMYERNYQGLGTFQDMGLGDWTSDERTEPLDWAVHGLEGFGAFASTYGIVDGDQTDLLMEYDDEDQIVHPNYMGMVRTKMLEMHPTDIQLIRTTGRPRMGSVALGDDGDIYQYTEDPDTGLGFFKKLFRRIGKGVRKIGRKIKKGVKWVGRKAKKLISKLPGGKYLVKLHNKIHKVAMKIARPLTKYVGKYAKKLAPIAAMIPGYGPAIAAGLYTAGKIAKVLRRTGVVTDKRGRPKFKSAKQAKAFKRRLKREAEKMKGRRRRRPRIARPRRSRPLMPWQMPTSRFRGRLLKAGTPEHRSYLRGLGLDTDNLEL